MPIRSFEQTGLPQDQRLRDAYALAKEVMESIGEAHADYFDRGILPTAKRAMAIHDASEEDKLRWCTLMYLSVATEFGGNKSATHAKEVNEKARAIAQNASISETLTYRIDLDDPKTDVSTVSNDVKALVALGLVVSFTWLSDKKYVNSRGAIQDRFNRHSAGIHEGDIPASLYTAMQESVAKINALEPS